MSAGVVSYDITPIFGALISRKMVTLNELRTIYTYDDVLLMWDIISVDNYNQKVIDKNYEAKNGKQ